MNNRMVVAATKSNVDLNQIRRAIRTIHSLRSGAYRPDVCFTFEDGKLYAKSSFGLHIKLGAGVHSSGNVRHFSVRAFSKKTSKSILESDYIGTAKVLFYGSDTGVLDVCASIGGREFCSDGDFVPFQSRIARAHDGENVYRFSKSDAESIAKIAQFSDWMSEPTISTLNAIEVDNRRAYATNRAVAASAPLSVKVPYCLHIRDVFSFIEYPIGIESGFGIFKQTLSERAGVVVGDETCTLLDDIEPVGIAQSAKRMFYSCRKARSDFSISTNDIIMLLRMVKRKKAAYAIAENGVSVGYSVNKASDGRFLYTAFAGSAGDAIGVCGRSVYVNGYDMTPARARIIIERVKNAERVESKVIMNGESGILYIAADEWEFSFICHSADAAIRAIKK